MKKNAILFLIICVTAVLGSLFLTDYNDLIKKSSLIPLSEQSYFIEQIDFLTHSACLKREINDTLEVSARVLARLSKNLPLAAKVINMSGKNNYAIRLLDKPFHYYATDSIGLRGDLYYLFQDSATYWFYAEGTARFLFHDYPLKGSMLVHYRPAPLLRTAFTAEIYVYPNERMARIMLTALLKMGFGFYADRMILNIQRKLNKTGKLLQAKPYIFDAIINTDTISQRYQLSDSEKQDLKEVIHIVKEERGWKYD